MIEQSESAPVQQQSSGMAMLRALGKAAALYLVYALAVTAFNKFSPPLPPLLWALIGALSTVGYLLIIVYALRWLAKPALTLRQEVALFCVSLVVFLALNPMVWQAVQLLHHGTNFWELFATLTAVREHPIIDAVVPFFLILTGMFFGRMVSRLIRERALLVPVAIISGMIDFWGVYWGPVNAMSENAPAAVSGIGSAATVSASVPPAAIEHLSGPLAVLAKITPPDSIGIGDFVFLTLFLACAYRLGFSAKRIMWGIFCGLLLASAIMALDGQTILGHDITIEYLPGLLFICGGVLLSNLRAWKLARQEWAMTGVLVVLLASLISVSVVRTELNKPRENSVQYTMSVVAAHELPEKALVRVAADAKDLQLQVIPIEGRFLFTIEGKHARLVKWAMLAMSRRQRITRRSTWEHTIIGVQAKPNQPWTIMCDSANPPKTVLPILEQGTHSRNELAIFRRARGIPPSAFMIIDKADTYMSLVHGQKNFMLRLQQHEGSIIDERGKVLTRIPYVPVQ
ncbi:MAG TPA: hypothetical protein VHV83_13865 [Armatimonadota bacterium]|nr:hypothetical protein [Armatimonadota bacterium]